MHSQEPTERAMTYDTTERRLHFAARVQRTIIEKIDLRKNGDLFLDVQMSWQAQHFVNLHAQISYQAQHFVNLHAQISWQAQHFVNLHAPLEALAVALSAVVAGCRLSPVRPSIVIRVFTCFLTRRCRGRHSTL